MNYKIQIPYKVSSSVQINFENNLSYLSDIFISFSVTKDGAIEYSLNPHASEEHAKQCILDMIVKLKPQYQTEEVTVFDNTKFTPRNNEPIFQKLVDLKIVFEHLPGIFSFHGLFHDMYMALEAQVLAFSEQEKAQKVILPITTSIQDLQTSSFFNRTPHFANFVSLLKNQTIRSFPFF